MQARILSIHRPAERLLTTREVAARLDISYSAALAFLSVHGLRLSGKPGGRLYITEDRLHKVLLDLQRGK